MERDFGMPKARFHVLLKRRDMDLNKNVPDMVATCLVIHNMCIMHNDSFITNWVLQAEQDLQTGYKELETQMQGSCTLNEVRAIVTEDPNDILHRGQSGGDGVVEGSSSSSCHGSCSSAERRNNLECQ